VCSDEDRSISYYPPDKRTGRNKEKDGTRRVNYNGVLNPEGTGDLIQYAACPGPNERQNMRYIFHCTISPCSNIIDIQLTDC